MTDPLSGPLLHERWPALRASLPHLPLDERRPTPVRPLAGLDAGDVELWLKDDGAYGAGGWGGNKVRKLEWLLPAAERHPSRTILTFGGLGTNWGLATALYGRERSVEVILALIDQPIDGHVRDQLERLAASGATIHRTRTKARTVAAVPWLLLRHRRGRHLPYLLPAGGSSPLGAVGYVEAALEIAAQVEAGELPEPNHVVTAVGSGGTAAGLALGLRLAGLRTRVAGIVVSDALRLDRRALLRLAARSAALLGRRGAAGVEAAAGDLDLDSLDGWIGAGYGHRTEAAERASTEATAAGLELDPVYTAKAMAATLELARSGRLGTGPVLFVHTDGPRPRSRPAPPARPGSS
jgi:D-cysteine desulfhydrase